MIHFLKKFNKTEKIDKGNSQIDQKIFCKLINDMIMTLDSLYFLFISLFCILNYAGGTKEERWLPYSINIPFKKLLNSLDVTRLMDLQTLIQIKIPCRFASKKNLRKKNKMGDNNFEEHFNINNTDHLPFYIGSSVHPNLPPFLSVTPAA